jgi:hypothetical protein
MHVAPAAAEVAVVTGAVVEAACKRVCSSRQQWRHGCGSKQRVCVRQQAVAARGTIAMDGRQPACVRKQAADVACVRQCAMAAAWVQQRAAVAACVRQRAGAAGSTIAMGDSDGSGQPVAQLRWVAAAAAQRTAGWRQDCRGKWQQ